MWQGDSGQGDDKNLSRLEQIWVIWTQTRSVTGIQDISTPGSLWPGLGPVLGSHLRIPHGTARGVVKWMHYFTTHRTCSLVLNLVPGKVSGTKRDYTYSELHVLTWSPRSSMVTSLDKTCDFKMTGPPRRCFGFWTLNLFGQNNFFEKRDSHSCSSVEEEGGAHIWSESKIFQVSHNSMRSCSFGKWPAT